MQVIPAMQATNRNQVRMIMGAVLVMIMSLAVILPITSYAFFPRYYPVIHYAPIGGGSGFSGSWHNPSSHFPGGSGGGSGNTGNSNNGSTPSTSTTTQSRTVTLTNTTTTVTITKTYTQVVTQTYVINHYIKYYLYPTLKWVFTLVNIGTQQQAGYHTISSEKLFTPGYGFGGGGIFVPVYSQEAVYAFNYAPSVKPVITGWYVGGTSESSSPPSLASQSVSEYLSSIQEAVNTIQDQAKITLTNTTTIINNTKIVPVPKPGQNNTNIITEWPLPYFYGTKDFVNTSYTAAGYAQQAFNDFTHGNIPGGLQNLLNVQASTAKFGYMLAWDDFAIPTYVVSSIVTTPLTPWSIAHALKAGVNAVENAVGTVVNFFSHL
jgi:hypothetical protein